MAGTRTGRGPRGVTDGRGPPPGERRRPRAGAGGRRGRRRTAGRLEREAPQSPHVTLNAAIARDFELGFGRLTVSTNGAYSSSNYSQLTNAPVTRIPADFVMNARVGLADHKDRFEVALSVKNLLDRERILYAFDITGPPLGLVENTMAPPRWFTLEARARF